ncbi:MAG: hypothetical protein LQ349_005343 [Xanthoria aureola]|nr:MAG: hypothetical protein LQ349_005343 [Xanthoria aureola]
MLKPVAAAPTPRPDDTRHLQLPPNHVRAARREYVEQYARTGEVSEDIVDKAFSLPKVLCDNSGCDQLHIAEDCELSLLSSKVYGKTVKLTTPKVLRDIPPRSGVQLVRTTKAPLQARLWRQAQLRAGESGLGPESTASVAVPKLSAPTSSPAVEPPSAVSQISSPEIARKDLPASKASSSPSTTEVATSSGPAAPQRGAYVSTHVGSGSTPTTGIRTRVPPADVRLSQRTAGETNSLAKAADTRSSQMTATATSSVSDSLMNKDGSVPSVGREGIAKTLALCIWCARVATRRVMMLTDVRIQITRNVTRRGTKDGSVDTANDATSQSTQKPRTAPHGSVKSVAVKGTMPKTATGRLWTKEKIEADDVRRQEELRTSAKARQQEGSDEPSFFQQTFTHVTGEDRRKISTVSQALPFYTSSPMEKPAGAGDLRDTSALTSDREKEKSVDTEDSDLPWMAGRSGEPRKDWFGQNIVSVEARDRGEKTDWSKLDDSDEE